MFLASSPKPIDPQLQKLVDEIEAQSSGLSVLAARQFRYSLHQSLVEVTISEPRKFNVLEEFVLRAGIELDPPPTEDELAAVLGLDSVFVHSTAATLRKLQTLEGSRVSQITVTPQGRQFYEQGTVLQPPYCVQIYAVADPLVGQPTFHFESLDTGIVNQPDLADFVTIENQTLDISSLPLEELRQQVQASGLGLHVPEESKIVTSYSVTAPPQTVWKTISLFVLFDVLEDKVRLQVRRGKRILEDASNWLDILLAEGKVFLNSLCELSDETIAYECDAILKHRYEEVEVRINKIQQIAIENARKSKANEAKTSSQVSSEIGSVILLRDCQIRKAFIDTLNSARHNILIYSPWVSEEVVDDEFIRLSENLAKRGVSILIGYGIARRQEDEDRPIPPKVEQKLREVKTPEGLPAVQVFWLGNSHTKEVVVDRKVHLCGSHNWLSYRGDKLPRGETIYQVTIDNLVQEAYEFLAGRFQSYSQQLWDEAVHKRNSQLAEVPICIWGALSLEEMALNQLQQNNFLELLPVWLKIALQGLRHHNLSPDSASFATALSLLSEISETEPDLGSLRERWCQVMEAIATHNPDIALTLLTDEAWSQLTRLGIVQPPVDSPEQLISKYTAAQKQPAKTSQRKRTSPSNRKPKK